MQTLLIVVASAFFLSALIWFCTWAFWIHPPEGWLGDAVISAFGSPNRTDVRKRTWFRALRVITAVLGALTMACLWVAD